MRNKMKKWIVLLLAAVMCLSLCACGASGKRIPLTHLMELLSLKTPLLRMM